MNSSRAVHTRPRAVWSPRSTLVQGMASSSVAMCAMARREVALSTVKEMSQARSARLRTSRPRELVGRGESSCNDRIVHPSALCACKSGKLFSEGHAPLFKSRLPKSTAPTTPSASIGAMVASEVSGVDSGSVRAGGVARPNTNICPNKMGSLTMILLNTKTPQTMRTKKRRKQGGVFTVGGQAKHQSKLPNSP